MPIEIRPYGSSLFAQVYLLLVFRAVLNICTYLLYFLFQSHIPRLFDVSKLPFRLSKPAKCDFTSIWIGCHCASSPNIVSFAELPRYHRWFERLFVHLSYHLSLHRHRSSYQSLSLHLHFCWIQALQGFWHYVWASFSPWAPSWSHQRSWWPKSWYLQIPKSFQSNSPSSAATS